VTSLYARDPVTRMEFLSAYLSRVQFRWYKHGGSEYSFRSVETLPAFLDIFYCVRLTRAFKHLTIQFQRRMRQSGVHLKPSAMKQRTAFRLDISQLRQMFGALQKYEIAAELTFSDTRPCWKPVLEREEELCKIRLQAGQLASMGYSSFTTDEELRRCADEGTSVLIGGFKKFN
jgi:hypothetical protein